MAHAPDVVTAMKSVPHSVRVVEPTRSGPLVKALRRDAQFKRAVPARRPPDVSQVCSKTPRQSQAVTTTTLIPRSVLKTPAFRPVCASHAPQATCGSLGCVFAGDVFSFEF